MGAAAAAGADGAPRRIRAVAAARPRGDADTGRDHRAALPAVGASAPERRFGGVGAGARRPGDRAVVGARAGAVPPRPRRYAPTRGAAGVARLVVCLAPARRVRHGARASGFGAPPGARELLCRGPAALVAGRLRTALGRREVAVPLRCFRARLAPRAAPCPAPEPRLRLLR